MDCIVEISDGLYLSYDGLPRHVLRLVYLLQMDDKTYASIHKDLVENSSIRSWVIIAKEFGPRPACSPSYRAPNLGSAVDGLFFNIGRIPLGAGVNPTGSGSLRPSRELGLTPNVET